MSILITPVDYETHIPGLELGNVSASFFDMAPPSVRKVETLIDKNFESKVELTWSQDGTSAWTDLFLGPTGMSSQWEARAILKPVDGPTVVREVEVPYAASVPDPQKTLTISFPADSLDEGFYQLFLTCHLRTPVGVQLGTVFSAQGRTIEVFDAELVHP